MSTDAEAATQEATPDGEEDAVSVPVPVDTSPAAEAPQEEPAAATEESASADEPVPEPEPADVEAEVAAPAVEVEAAEPEAAVATPEADAATPEADAATPEAESAAPEATLPAEDDALAVRTAIVEEAERLRESKDWTKTSNAFRDLLARWRDAGSAGRQRDDALWSRFSAARDAFFEARNHHHAERARSTAAAAEKKRALVEECEKLLDTVTDARAIGRELDRLMAEWKAAGHAGPEEGRLWTAFRAARERAYAARREAASAADRKRGESRALKEELVTAAEALPGNLDADALEAELERQMTAWKAAGFAGREHDDALWERFREARGTAVRRLRGARARADEQRQQARRSAEQVVEEARRLAFSDSTPDAAAIQRVERAWKQAEPQADEAARAGYAEAHARLDERKNEPAAANPLATARANLVSSVRDLEDRCESLRAEGKSAASELKRTERRLEEERERLAKMDALLGAS